MSKSIILAAEESAVHLKKQLVEFMERKHYTFTDATEHDHMDYIQVGSLVGQAVSSGAYDMGIVLCGSGMGVNLVANRYPRVYCGLCESLHTAKMARTITNCNVLAMGGNIVAYDLACRMVEAFVETDFTEGFDPDTAQSLRDYFASMSAVDAGTHK